MEPVSPKSKQNRSNNINLKRGKNNKIQFGSIFENKISGVHGGRGSQFCESRLQH